MEQLMITIPDEANYELASPYLLNLYKDFGERILWCDDEITEDSLEYVKYILNWNREDAKAGLAPNERKPIRIFFHSPGGSLDVQDVLKSVISLSKTPVIGIAMGSVASAAAYMFLSCHKRYMLKTAYFLFHLGSVATAGNAADVLSAMKDYQQQLDDMVREITEHTKYTDEEVKENIKADWIIRSTEALEHGIVDGIIEDIDILL